MMFDYSVGPMKVYFLHTASSQLYIDHRTNKVDIAVPYACIEYKAMIHTFI